MTVTVWQHPLVFPHWSVANQHRVTVKLFPGCVLVTVPETLIDAPPQLSVAVGASKSQAVPHCTVLLDAQVMIGAVVSLKLMVCRQLALLPQPSVAVQVRRMLALPVQFVAPKESPKTRLVMPPQVSVAVATPVLLVVGATVHSRVILVGHTITGGVVSLKLMVCTQLALLPQPSVAVQVRRMVALPVQFVAPKESLKTRLVMPLQVSVALATPVLLVVGATVHSRVILVGHTITGGVVSWKLMVCTQVALLPQPSVAVQVRRMVAVPVQFVAPKESPKTRLVMPLHVSVALATPVLLVEGATVHSRVILVGHTITGGVVSLKLMVWMQLALLPQPSVAVQVRRMVALPVQFVAPKESPKTRLVMPLQVSVALATPVLLVVGATVHSRVILVGHTITGGVVSLKLMVWMQVALLPQPSVAVQVRRMVAVPVQFVAPKESPKTRLVMPLHVSVALATPVLLVVGATVHSRVILVGHTITGGVVSLKLMVWMQVALLPQPSVAVQVRRMVALPVQFVPSKASLKNRLVMPL